MQNVIVVNFEDDSKAYEAMTNLKELDGQDRVQVAGAAVVVREDDGRVVVKDEAGDTGLAGTATGGIIGLLIGVVGGPFGVLVGGATGLFAGSLFDLGDAADTESVLSEISRSVRVGHTALLAEVGEQSAEVVDAAMARLGGTVERESLDDVHAEIAAAEDAQRTAENEARRHLREQRKAQARERVQAQIQELKEKLHRSQPVPAGHS